MKKIKIEFIKDHEGQFAKKGETKEVEESVGKHLIRYGYASDIERQGFEGAKDEIKSVGKFQKGATN